MISSLVEVNIAAVVVVVVVIIILLTYLSKATFFQKD